MCSNGSIDDYISISRMWKKENTTTAGNEGNSQVSQMQESSSKSEEKSTSQSNDQLESQISIFNGFTGRYLKDIRLLEQQG